MTGLEADDVLRATKAVMRRPAGIDASRRLIPDEYTVVNASERAVNFILSTVGRLDQWTGRRRDVDRSAARPA
jgi:hypothetical protein